MENGFDRAGFMAYLENTFNGFENAFLRETVNNIIDYAQKWEHVSKDQFCFFLSDMLPELDFSEIAAYCDDDILTNWGREQKQSRSNKRGLYI